MCTVCTQQDIFYPCIRAEVFSSNKDLRAGLSSILMLVVVPDLDDADGNTLYLGTKIHSFKNMFGPGLRLFRSIKILRADPSKIPYG